MIKSYGFNINLEREHSSEKDWFRGIFPIPCLTDIAPEDREKYLPIGEDQNFGSEKSDCITRAFLNVLETKFTWLLQNKKFTEDNEQWLRDNGYVQNERVTFSDRFIAIRSGTSPTEGNSMKMVVETIRTTGLIPKSIFPQVPTTEEYYDVNKITPAMEQLSRDFLLRFTLNYEKFWLLHMDDTLRDDIEVVAAFAWPIEINGEYPSEPTYPFNHCFIVFKPKYYAFDNYIADGIYIKKLSPDYRFMEYGYRIVVTSQNDIKKKLVGWTRLFDTLFRQKLIFREFKIFMNEWYNNRNK